MTPLDRPGQPIEIRGIGKRFGAAIALQDVCLSIGGGELVTLLGPSGCGKTTLLRIIAGFVPQDSGTIRIGDKAIDAMPPNRREVGLVFQDYALFPHLSVAQNVGYGLAARRRPRHEIEARVTEVLSVVRLQDFTQRRPHELSGGQKQRVALARALAIRPSILLLDEPFAALDKALRLDLQIEVRELQRRFGVTTILVTHDQEEALSLSDRIAVINRGQVEQFAPPDLIYEQCASLFVNTFVGTTNVLEGSVLAADGDLLRVEISGGHRFEVQATVDCFRIGQRIKLCIRPEKLVITANPSPTSLPAEVHTVLHLGPTLVYDLRVLGGLRLKVLAMRDGPRLTEGTAAWVSPSSSQSFACYPDPGEAGKSPSA